MKRVLFFLLFCTSIFSASNFLITKGASKCGVVIGHTDDGIPGDPRIVYIPAKNNKSATNRAVYLDAVVYPRHVGKKAHAYDTSDNPTQPIGHIEETTPHTYAYIEGNYGIINEHQLAMGECTNLSNFTFDYQESVRILGIAELTRIALERCTRAKEAILLMGNLAEKYGYYGDGETLLVGDTEEGWVFEISCSPDGRGAMWVAKKIPDGEVFVAVNQYRIQKISQDDPDVLYSKNLFTLAQKNQWITNNKNSINWQMIVSPGENHHPYAALRRLWRLFQKINPSLNFSPWVQNAFTTVYPFSIKPAHPLDIEEILNLFRDHYEGTEFDLTKGLAAGPYGCPNRNLDSSLESTEMPLLQKRIAKQDVSVQSEIINDDSTGAWERAISVPYIVYSYITQSRKDLPDPIGGKVWIGFAEPYNTCYIPCHVGIADLPDYFNKGNPILYDEQFGLLPFKLVSNWITCCYSCAIEDVKFKQRQLERAEISYQDSFEQSLLFENSENIKTLLTSYCKKNTQDIIDKWWNLFYLIVAKYSDGFINIPKVGTRIGYPQWWKDQVGFKKGPTTYNK